MSDLVSRLMSRRAAAQSALPTAIFGTAGAVQHEIQGDFTPIRIGLWPICSEEAPEAAMGLLVALSYLLERYREIKSYRLLAEVDPDDDPTQYTWKLPDSQFDVDDWQLEHLDDNVGIWGTLAGTKLTLFVESDLEDVAEEDTEAREFVYDASDLSQLVTRLPEAAADIANYLGVTELNPTAPVFTVEAWDTDSLRTLLDQAFHWELNLYLALWGQPWADAKLLGDADKLLDTGQQLHDLGAWLVSCVVARVMVSTESPVDEVFVPLSTRIIAAFEGHTIPTIVLSQALFDAQMPNSAFEMMEDALDTTERDGRLYLAGAELYRRGGRFTDALDVMQTAIEEDFADAALYQWYADLLIVLDYNQIEVGSVVLVDPDEATDHPVLWEAVEAYEAALERKPDDAIVLKRQLLQLVELEADDDRLWQGFGRLVQVDESGEQVRSVVDALFNVPDLDPAVRILQSAIQKSPDRVDLYLNLAAVYLLDEEVDAARHWLEKARTLTDDDAVRAEIERMLLAADDPELDVKLGEITDIVNAGNTLEVEDVEFLENILKQVPSFTEVCVLLAKAYLSWDEAGSALETLLDGYKHSPDDPEITALLSETLWDSGEEDLAFSYLHKGLVSNPHYVPLLALAGQCLFEDGQVEAARAYLLRAETISPRDPALVRVRQHIGRSLNA